MAFSLAKLLGKTSSKPKPSTDTTEAIIKDVENLPYGISDENVLFAGLNELGGYYFFQTVVVGALSIKTKTGATLNFKGENLKLQLKSDMPEFESGPSDIKGRNITKIDFEIEEQHIKQLEQAELKSVSLNVKNLDILFTKYHKSEEEE